MPVTFLFCLLFPFKRFEIYLLKKTISKTGCFKGNSKTQQQFLYKNSKFLAIDLKIQQKKHLELVK